MHRFIAFAWTAPNREEAPAACRLGEAFLATRPDWHEALKTHGLWVLHRGARPGRSQAYPIVGGTGVVIGTLFRHHSGAARKTEDMTFADPAITRLADDVRHHLIEAYWGRYVAFRSRDGGRRHWILRDPSGQFPCFHTMAVGIHLFFSHVADAAEIPDFKPAVNWQYIVANLSVPELAGRETGLARISTLLPGEAYEIKDTTLVRRLYWQPAAIYKRGAIETTFEEAAAQLRATVEACVLAWVSLYPRIMHNLSGGLDSAIVLACLDARKSRQNILCVNYRTATSEGDERYFARLAARRAGCRLAEIAMPMTSPFPNLRFEHPLTVAPDGSAFGAPTKKLECRLARAHGAEVFTSGEGGDHLFYQAATVLVAADFARRHGIGYSTLKVVVDIARWTGRSFWSVLESTLSLGLLRHSWAPAAEGCGTRPPFVQADALTSRETDGYLHPWLEHAATLPPGKAYQISLLSQVLERYEISARSEIAEILHPLLSQPLIEQVLRIPSYVLTRGGESRALARAAFRNAVPAEILARRVKGGTTSHFARLALENIADVREVLLDGLLAQQAFINRGKLELYLTPARLQRPGEIPRLFKLLATEAWLASWHRRLQRGHPACALPGKA